jgi:hypothetical protein
MCGHSIANFELIGTRTIAEDESVHKILTAVKRIETQAMEVKPAKKAKKKVAKKKPKKKAKKKASLRKK